MDSVDIELDEDFSDDNDETSADLEIEQSSEFAENEDEIGDIEMDMTGVEEDTEDISEEIDSIDTDGLVDIDTESEDELMDADEVNGLLRDVLDQNVSEQRLLSDSRVEWSEPEERGNSDCILRDDAEFTVKYKSNQEKVTYTGAEFKQHMLDEYGVDIVSYSHKEPDFTPFEQTFDKDKLEEFLSEKHGKKIELDAIPEGHVKVEQMGTDRNDTYGAAYDYCIDVLGGDVTKRDLQEFMSENDLTWHECGDRKTIRLVPSEINQVFAHTGGIGIEKDFEAMQSEMMDNLDDSNGDKGSFKLQREAMGGTAEDLDSAIEWKHNRYSERKSEMFGRK